ncbi:MAG: SET domain-containing protein [Planctomycetota bacterium]
MFCVQPSGIHGKGLFATCFIPADTVLGRLEGEPTTQDGAYVLWLEADRGFRVENDLKYINHSDEPNAAYFDDLTVAALTDIRPGEEITHNYLGDDADADGDTAVDFAESSDAVLP